MIRTCKIKNNPIPLSYHSRKKNFIMENFQDVFTPHATQILNNWGGIELEVSRCGDGCRYRFNFGEDAAELEVFEAEIVELDNPDWDGTDDDDNQMLSGFEHTNKNGSVDIYYLKDFMCV